MGKPTNIRSTNYDSGFVQLQTIYREFLTRLGFTFPGPCTEADKNLYKLAIEESIHRGIPYPGDASVALKSLSTSNGPVFNSKVLTDCQDDDPATRKLKAYFGPILFASVQITTTAYGHLSDYPSLQMLVAIFTGWAIYVDEAPSLGFQKDVENFQKSVLCNNSERPHPDPVLAVFDSLSKEIHRNFGPVEANFITAAMLNLSTSVILESMSNIEATEPSYAELYRRMAGVTDAYALFIFPPIPTIPLSDYIQAIPEIGTYLNHVNDILSFYKEEKAGENVNYISLLAKSMKVSKLDALRIAIEKVMTAHANTERILGHNEEALECYRRLSQGYITYHIYGERYHLNELGF